MQHSDSDLDDHDSQAAINEIQKINYQKTTETQRNKSNRYALQFYKETDMQIKRLKSSAMKSLIPSSKFLLETGSEYFDGFDFPKRPKWTQSMSKETLESNENRCFTVNDLYYLIDFTAISIKAQKFIHLGIHYFIGETSYCRKENS